MKKKLYIDQPKKTTTINIKIIPVSRMYDCLFANFEFETFMNGDVGYQK
jgi:hypothetical protein